MVSLNEAGVNLRETSPLPHNILHSREVTTLAETGQRTDLVVRMGPVGHRCWLLHDTNSKVSTGNLSYPVDVRDSAKSGLSCLGNRHLHYLAESTSVNVGGSYPDVKVSSLPMPDKSVGGSIVVGGWESQPQGEGSQEKDVPLYPLTATAPGIVGDEPQGAGCERERDDKAESNLSGGMPISGEPGAVKVARPVRRGECGNVPLQPLATPNGPRANRPLPRAR
jgi:hypothetical protein